VPTLKVELPEDSLRELISLACEARRPLPWEAEVLLMDAIRKKIRARARQAQQAAALEVVHGDDR
jgi:hypothetical protein